MIGLSVVNRESKSASVRAMWMFYARLQFEQVNHVNEPDFQVRESFPKQRRRGQSFLRGDISRGSQHNVGFMCLHHYWPNSRCRYLLCSG